MEASLNELQNLSNEEFLELYRQEADPTVTAEDLADEELRQELIKDLYWYRKAREQERIKR